MNGSKKTIDVGTVTDDIDDEFTESESTIESKRIQLFGLPLYNISYRRLPKKFLKFSFLGINFAIFLAGITAVIISIWMLTDRKLMLRLTGQKLFVTILLIIGLVLLSIAIEGIVAFIKRKRKYLTIYIGIHSILLCGIFIGSLMSLSFFERIMSKIHNDMKNTIVEYRLVNWITEAWDNTQEYLQCCGIKSYRDWEHNLIEIPHSCCSKTIDQCFHMNEGVAFTSGCLKNAYLMLKSSVDSVSVAVLFISLISGLSLYLALGVKARLMTIQYIDED